MLADQAKRLPDGYSSQNSWEKWELGWGLSFLEQHPRPSLRTGLVRKCHLFWALHDVWFPHQDLNSHWLHRLWSYPCARYSALQPPPPLPPPQRQWAPLLFWDYELLSLPLCSFAWLAEPRSHAFSPAARETGQAGISIFLSLLREAVLPRLPGFMKWRPHPMQRKVQSVGSQMKESCFASAMLSWVLPLINVCR